MKTQRSLNKSKMGMRQRWLLHAAVIAGTVALMCVLLITSVFAGNLYNSRESEILEYVDASSTYFDEYVNKSEEEYYDACVLYTQTCDTGLKLDLQFVDMAGTVIASSAGKQDGTKPMTAEIQEAVSSRGICTFAGKEPVGNLRIMAVSNPLIATNGEVIGVLRYVSQTNHMDSQIVRVAVYSLIGVLAMLTVFLLTVNHFAQSVLISITQITEKAQMISGGSYGIQITNKFDDEIGELAETINEMSMKINQNEKTQTEFISSLSHELRTPLTAITGWSETLLQDEELDENTHRGMKIIHREAGRLTEMVLSIMDFTRIQDGRMTLNMEMADLRSEFEDTVFMYGSRLEADGIHLEYLENEDDIPEVSCDPQRMRQVFLNILDNASKHAGEGKRIDAEIRSEEDSVLIRIRDYGPGIPEDEIPLVKKKFYKGSSKARGSGIGLAVCDEIVEMHGGQLILENASGGGTLVTVQLPVSP